MGEIAYCKIFPPIGIARLGDSRESDGWFYGPEFAGQEAHKAEGFPFRDAAGHIKRQAARFRIYAFNTDNEPVRELTAEDAEITWQVELANKKAAWFEFRGAELALKAFRGAHRSELPRARNAGIGAITVDPGKSTYRSDPTRARELEINGGKQQISGPRQGGNSVDGSNSFRFVGTFRNKEVELGELRTDMEGRLIVLGGFGESDAVDGNGRSIRGARWIRNYANNDDWHDDTSDGPVNATVRLKDGRALEVAGAWVVVAPPDFAPDITNLVTLFDVMEEVVERNPTLIRPGVPAPRHPDCVYFDTDIAPVLQRMHAYRWVNALGLRGHGFGKPGDFQKPGEIERLEASLGDPDPQSAGAAIRRRIFSVLRAPHYQRGPDDTSSYESEIAVQQATGVFMPPLAGDEGDPVPGDPKKWLSVTHLQYARLDAWHRGRFQRGADPAKPTCKVERQIVDLTRTTLEACAGGAFYPGIEMTVIAREPLLYREGFRFDHDRLQPGDVTKYMALPWQADFWECSAHWWPAQRPDDVITDEDFDLLVAQFTEEISGDFNQQFDRVLFNRRRWDRGLGRRARPSDDYITSRLLPSVQPTDSVHDYVDLLTTVRRDLSDEGYERFQAMDPLARLFVTMTPAASYTRLTPSDAPGSADRLPNPWRLHYLCQEALDRFSGLYFHLVVPPPDASLRQLNPLDDLTHLAAEQATAAVVPACSRARESLRRDWDLLRIRQPASATSMIRDYSQAIVTGLSAQISEILLCHPDATSAEALRAALKGGSMDDLERDSPHDFNLSSSEFRRLRAAEMIAEARDALYLRILRYSGDEDMIDRWANHGFVVGREVQVERVKDGKPAYFNVRAQVEVARNRYEGLSFRDYFYILMNIEQYEDFIPYARTIVEQTLQYAQSVIDTVGLADKNHPESFVEYSRESFAAKLEEIYEILRNQAATSLGWRTTSTRADVVQRIRDRAPFNQTDGAWLRYVASAGPTDKVRSLLFEVWSDEIGGGDPALHHGNLF